MLKVLLPPISLLIKPPPFIKSCSISPLPLSLSYAVKSEAERENYLYQKHLPQLLVSVMRRNCEINFSLGEKKISFADLERWSSATHSKAFILTCWKVFPAAWSKHLFLPQFHQLSKTDAHQFIYKSSTLSHFFISIFKLIWLIPLSAAPLGDPIWVAASNISTILRTCEGRFTHQQGTLLLPSFIQSPLIPTEVPKQLLTKTPMWSYCTQSLAAKIRSSYC